MTLLTSSVSGLVLIDKPKAKTSFYLVHFLRKLTGVKKIGHAGTLDPFATGVMVLLVGKRFTQKAQDLIGLDKEYHATLTLGQTTDSYDCDGIITSSNPYQPSLGELEAALQTFQGEVFQTPPMFSAKKVKGKKLYELARQGITIERKPKCVTMEVELLSYEYPQIQLYVKCSSGTYIRSIAHDLGQALKCGAYLSELKRTRVGPFHLQECQTCDELSDLSKLKLRDHF